MSLEYQLLHPNSISNQNLKEQFLAEQLGECVPIWEEKSNWDGVERNYSNFCIKCSKGEYEHKLRTPFQSADKVNKFFILWNWANRQEWFGKFILRCFGDYTIASNSFYMIPTEYINYDKFSDALVNFLRDRDNG